MTATILPLTLPAQNDITYSDESPEAQLVRAKRTIAHLNEQIDSFKQALRTIADFPYFEKEQDEDGNWITLSDDDAHDYLQKAVTIALHALFWSHSPQQSNQILIDMMTAINRATVTQREIEQ